MSRWERGVQALRAHQLPVVEPLLADVVALGLLELGAYLGELRARGHELGLRQAEPGAGLGVVEARQDRALAHPQTLLDQHLGDLAGDLGRDGGLEAGGDVTARVQHRAGRAPGRGGARHRGLHHRRTQMGPAEPEPDPGHQDEECQDREQTAAPARRTSGAAIDAELLQEVGLFHGRGFRHEVPVCHKCPW